MQSAARSQWVRVTPWISILTGPRLLVPAIAGLFYFIAALIFIPYPGLQNDELFFSGPIYYPETTFYQIVLGSTKIPLMVMSYSGALKTWLYMLLFKVFEPGVWSVRVPVALMGVGTIWLTWVWVRRIAGTRAAIIATALLATDTLFLLTDIFDWGPVAIQHLLLMAGLVAIQRWVATSSKKLLALGFFLWGLGIWDKALLIWPLIGLGVACILIYPGPTFRRIRIPAALIGLAAFSLGMSPLIVYNIETHGETAAANANLTSDDIPTKIEILRRTINGSSLFGYIVGNDSVANQRAPQTVIERIAVTIFERLGPRRTNWMMPACIAGLLCLLPLWRTPARRILLFLLIATIVTWLQMALTRGAGLAPHHVILLWPFPLVFLGIALARIADRLPRFGPLLVATVVAVLAAGNILTTNDYLRELAVNGGIGGWTDAIFPLSDSLADTSEWVGLVDWGYLTPLEILHQGQLHLFVVDPDANAPDIRHMVNSSEILYIQHTDDKQLLPDINGRFLRAAQSQGYSERVERTISDSNGRPVFELFRFERSSEPNQPIENPVSLKE